MNPTGWVLLLFLSNPKAPPLVLKTSAEGCAAFMVDVHANGYRPTIYTAEGAEPAAFALCAPVSSAAGILTMTRLWAPCRPGGICAPVDPSIRRTSRRLVASPAASRSSKTWSAPNVDR